VGNIFSDEPGIYRAGEYGIRIENLVNVVEDVENEFGTFFKFETLTKFPICTKLIDTTLLTDDEINWINDYHKDVLNSLSPFANEKQLKLLKRLTMPI
jgi:Xaa-Pro aminopeptidase